MTPRLWIEVEASRWVGLAMVDAGKVFASPYRATPQDWRDAERRSTVLRRRCVIGGRAWAIHTATIQGARLARTAAPSWPGLNNLDRWITSGDITTQAAATSVRVLWMLAFSLRDSMPAEDVDSVVRALVEPRVEALEAILGRAV